MARFALTIRQVLLLALLAATTVVAGYTPSYAAAAQRAVLAYPGTPYAVHGVIRYRSWKGPCLNVRHGVTGVTRDIPFKNNVCSINALRSFLGNSVGYVTRAYDMTGNGRDLVQATTANQPSISVNYILDGIPSISIDGTPDSNLKNLKFLATTGMSLSTQSLTYLQWNAQLSSQNVGVMWAFRDSGNVSRLQQYVYGSLASLNTPGTVTFDGVTANRSDALISKLEGNMIGVTGSASALMHYLDGGSASYAAPSSATVTNYMIGNDGGTAGYNSSSWYGDVVYNTTLTAGDVAIVRAQQQAAYGRAKASVQLIVDSNSNDIGYGSSNGQVLWRYLMSMLPRPVSIINQSIWGNTAANANTYFATNITPYFDTSYPRRVYISGQGVNDITGGASGATAYASVIAAVNKAKAAGATHTGVTLVGSNAGEYGAFNTLVIAGKGTDFDEYLSGPLDPRIINPTDYTDNHLNATGQLKAAQSDSQALAKLLGF